MTAPRAAIVFPGMGPTRFADVARFLATDPAARDLVGIADDVVGYRLLRRWRETGEDYSESAQVAFLVSCVALACRAEKALGVEPVVVAAPSFGARAAAAFTGSLSFSDTVSLTARLARCVEDFFARCHQDVVTLSFARTSLDRLAECLSEMDARGEWYDVSCRVDDDFHMVSVREHSVDRLRDRVARTGGLVLYAMKPPMHSSAFADLRDIVEEQVFDSFTFADPSLPVVSDHDGRLVGTAEELRTMLLDQVVLPVCWPDTVAALRRLGVTTVAVCGPDALFGRVRITRENFEVVRLNTVSPRPHRAPVE